MDPKGMTMFGTTFFLFFAVIYVYMALVLMTIATKTNTRTAGSPGFQSPIFS